MSVSFDPTKLKREEKACGAAPADPGSGPFNGVDPIAIAFFYLMEAANTTSQTAILNAKGLSQNAVAQQKLDQEAAELTWANLPTAKVDHHTRTVWTWHWGWGNKGHGIKTFGLYETGIRTMWTTVANTGAIHEAQEKNQQTVAARQIIGDRLGELQQSSRITGARVNETVDVSMQDIQEGQSLLQMLQALTYKALMRQPPQ